MATAQDLIDSAIRKLGLGILTPSTTNRNNGLIAMNHMLASWGAERSLVYVVSRENFTLTINKASYTIGSAGDFNTVRPVKIVDAFYRDAGVDFPLHIGILKEHNSIIDKAVDGAPRTIYYVPEFPLGKILLDFEPDKAYTLFIDSWKHLEESASLSTNFTGPPEYRRAIIYNLAIELAPEFDAVLSKEVFAIANESKAAIEAVNSTPAEESRFDAAITNRGRRDIKTDSYRGYPWRWF